MAEETREPVKRAVPAVTRAVAILRHLGRSPEPVGVNQLARELELVPSTCLHILRVLTDEGLVTFDPQTKRYAIDVGILTIARTAIQRNAFIHLVQPYLDDLAEGFGATVLATQLTDQSHMVVVALSQVQQPFRLQVDMGSRFPALISATGRCHAAFGGLDEEALREGFKRLKWDHAPLFDTWLKEVEQVKRDGYAVDRGSYISGVTVVAVPFLDARGRMIRSLVAIGISERLAARGIEDLAAEMLRVRDEVDAMQVGDTA